MKILYVTHKPFYPVTGGDCIRMSQMLEELLRHGEVDVMYLVHKRGGEPIKMFNHSVGEEFVVVAGSFRRLLRAVATLFNRKPLLVNLYRHEAFRRRLLEIAPRYDAVVLGSLGTADYCVDLHDTGVDAYVDLTDSASMNLDNDLSVATGLRRLWVRLNAGRMRRLETLWRSTARAIAFISEVDRDYIKVAGEKAVIVSNRVELPAEDMTCNHGSPDDLLFVGNMSYGPNITAVTRFVADVLPRVVAALPGVRFHVVGSGTGEKIRALGRENPHVVVEGYVEDLAECYSSAGIFVAPMYSGSGIQNKILQALAAGCCVVTTPIGAEGLDVDSDAFVVADSDEAMAQAIVSLAKDADARRGYGRRAREYVARTFSREVVAREVEQFLNQFIIHNS